jgi:hypothetical protein
VSAVWYIGELVIRWHLQARSPSRSLRARAPLLLAARPLAEAMASALRWPDIVLQISASLTSTKLRELSAGLSYISVSTPRSEVSFRLRIEFSCACVGNS